MRAALTVCLAALLGLPSAARAEEREGRRPACTRALSDLGVRFRRVRRKGIEVAVRIRGRLGGVKFRPYRKRQLVIDCSLAYSLARAGRVLRELGIDRVVYSSAYDRRKIRGTDRWSHHSFGLAIDVHTFSGPELAETTVRDDYEQGLGYDQDCEGEALTEPGAILRAVDCRLTESGWFRIVLTPDYDADHYNHFHLEALPWDERPDPVERAAGPPSG